MTQLLEKAIAELKQRSSEEQDAIAQRILDEIEDEKRWDETFANSQDVLSKLAEQARQNIRAGKVKQIGMDEL